MDIQRAFDHASSLLRKWEPQHNVSSAASGCHQRNDHSIVPCIKAIDNQLLKIGRKIRTNLIFLKTISHDLASVLRFSRISRRAREESMILHSPKPSALSKYSAAFIGCTIGYTDGVSEIASSLPVFDRQVSCSVPTPGETRCCVRRFMTNVASSS